MAEKEYIEREKLNDMLEDFCVNETFYDAMQTIPAADVVPVRHGEWQEINGIFRCSLCEYSFEHEGYQHFFNYCPNCGAKMDGGD